MPAIVIVERNEIKNHYIVIAYLQTHFIPFKNKCIASFDTMKL